MNRRLTEKPPILRFVQPNVGKYLFELADLDDAAWSQSEYYGAEMDGVLKELCLIYRGLRLPNFIATIAESDRLMRELLTDVVPLLPSRFTAGLSPGISSSFVSRFRVEDQGAFFRMALTNLERVKSIDVRDVEPLTEQEESNVVNFFIESFPTVRIDSLAMRPRSFFGFRRAGQILSVAGTTFLSDRYGVAIVGPVATRPDSRGQGLATRTTARLCMELASLGAKVIGLHVRAENAPAIRSYKRLGFTETAPFRSYLMTEIT